MAIRAKLGAGVWDFIRCEDCEHYFESEDVNYEWTDEPETGSAPCPHCGSNKTVREERG